MKLTVKSYKSLPGKEGDAFNCSLYVDGKRAAVVSYDGWGGPYDYDWTPSDKKRFGGPLAAKVKAWVKTLPPLKSEYGDLPMDLDILTDDVINAMLEERQVKRWCRTKTVFRLKGDKAGNYRTVEAKYSARVRAFIMKKYPKAEILNERFGQKAA
jgi:hypothetical protein